LHAFLPTVPMLRTRSPPSPTLFPYTTLFRSIEGAIESFELAFRMQETAPEVMDINREPKHIHEMYGIGNPDTDNFGRQCLLARRDRKSTRLNSSHVKISYAVFCLKKKTIEGQ